MAEHQDQKAMTPKTVEMDDAELLGFEHIEVSQTVRLRPKTPSRSLLTSEVARVRLTHPIGV